jgi:protein pelota
MIAKQAGNSNTAFFVIPEDADDLFTLRRLIEAGDYVIADTTRIVKQEKEFGRPDKGERIKVRVSVRVEQIGLDSTVDRLRILGTITNSDNELVSKGMHHSLSVTPGDMITIDKDRKWQEVELRMLKSSGAGTSFILVAIDTQEAAVAKVSGTHVKVIPNIYSGQSGKRYQTKNVSLEVFFAETAKTVSSVLSENDRVVIFGPGETKRRFYNTLVEKFDVPKDRAQVADGVDVAGEDGVFVFLRSPAIKEVMESSKLAIVSGLLDRVMLMVNRGESKFAMGLKEVSEAAAIKAIESVVFSDSVFNSLDESTVVKLLNSIEAYGAKTYAVDSSTDIGMRVSSLGGIVAILRYPIR